MKIICTDKLIKIMGLKQITSAVLFIMFFLMILSIEAQKKEAVDYVNPLIGTPEAGFKDGIDGNNHTIPERSFGNPNSNDWYVFS